MTNPYFKYLSVEDKQHILVVNYIKDKLPEVIAFHTPNESKKSSFERYKASIMGIMKGIPDFVFLHPKYPSYNSKEAVYNGLCIELKAPEYERVVKKGKNEGKVVRAIGKLSDEQADILEKLNKFGFKAVCCYGANEAISVIEDYFNDYFELKRMLKIRSNQTLK